LEQEIIPKTPPIELKQLPPGLQYVFLNGDRETPVIISNKLSHEETQKLVATLEKYRSVIGYSLKDLKGISPSLCTHRIPMDQDNKPIREHQRRLNNTMREVVKEVLKLLKARWTGMVGPSIPGFTIVSCVVPYCAIGLFRQPMSILQDSLKV
jgi:hypothetical protein